MDDFTVRGGGDPAGNPAAEPEVDEDITGAAGVQDLPMDPHELMEEDEPTLRPQSLDEFVGQ